jgi:hyperosmotically inducible protein
MTRIRHIAAGAILVALFASSAFAQEERKDLQVFKDVSDAVLGYPRFTIFDDVSASIEQGAITLSGKVTMPFKRTDIEARVTKVPGVKRVENKISVLPVSIDDDQLRYLIARAIYGHSAFWQYATMSNPPIHVVVDRGRVTLTGVVNSNVERMLARSLATGFGAFSLTSELKTDAEVRTALEKMGM